MACCSQIRRTLSLKKYRSKKRVCMNPTHSWITSHCGTRNCALLATFYYCSSHIQVAYPSFIWTVCNDLVPKLAMEGHGTRACHFHAPSYTICDTSDKLLIEWFYILHTTHLGKAGTWILTSTQLTHFIKTSGFRENFPPTSYLVHSYYQLKEFMWTRFRWNRQ